MKYIINTDALYGGDIYKSMLLMGTNGKGEVIVQKFNLDELEELTADYINEHFGDLQDEAYQRGLDDAWEAAKKLSWTEKYGGYGECLDKVFDRTDTFDFLEYSPNEAIEKLKAYEEKQKADGGIDEKITGFLERNNYTVDEVFNRLKRMKGEE